MSFEDKTIQCADCGKDFTFSTAEQEQFRQKGYTNQPKRCPDCRQARREQQNRTGSYSSGGYNSSYSQAPRQMYPAVCADCGKSTMVPFEPRQGKPVYCSDCYRKISPRKYSR